MTPRRKRLIGLVSLITTLSALIGLYVQTHRHGAEWTVVKDRVAIRHSFNTPGTRFAQVMQRFGLDESAQQRQDRLDKTIERLKLNDRLPLPYRIVTNRDVKNGRPILRPYDLAHLPASLRKSLQQTIATETLKLHGIKTNNSPTQFTRHVPLDITTDLDGSRATTKSIPSTDAFTDAELSDIWAVDFLVLAAADEFVPTTKGITKGTTTTWSSTVGSFETHNGTLVRFTRFDTLIYNSVPDSISIGGATWDVLLVK
jgi:hypothetical protein